MFVDGKYISEAHHVLGKNSYMDMSIPIAGCAHQAGTCRFGTGPAASVLTAWPESAEQARLPVSGDAARVRARSAVDRTRQEE